MRRERFPTLSPAAALLPLRLFLGGTFVYAGIQKLSDPGFLHPGASSYIGTQLQGYAAHTPGGWLLRTFAIPHASIAGVGAALFEIVIGLLTLTGLLTRVAAACGLVLNLLFFLTASWHTKPYFMGADIVFVFAWLPFALTGATGQPALDHELERRASRAHDPARRVFLGRLLGATGVGTLAIAGVSALAKGRYRSSAQLLGTSHAKAKPTPTPPAKTTTTPAKATRPSVPANAVELAPSSRLARGSAAYYRDPSSGKTDILIRQSDGSLTALSAVCTHAGCQVGYRGGQIACPCHGGTFDPHTGAVTGGPPPAPLAKRQVLERGGKIYALPS